MLVGDRIRELRERAGLTLEEAGRIAGTTKQSASQIEKGITKVPGGLFLYRWAKHYGVSLEWLITGKGDEQASQPARLDPETIRVTYQLLRGAYADGGKEYDIEREPDLFATVYERLAALAREPTMADVVSIGRAIGERQQGADDEGKAGPGRTGGAHSRSGKQRAAG